jgi:hypothetical protein
VRFNDDTFFGLTRSDSTAMFESDPNAWTSQYLCVMDWQWRTLGK